MIARGLRRGGPAGAAPVPRLLCIAHRGASGRAPENTLASFEAALADGADAIEIDVRLTADGVPIVLHDADLDRTTDGRGPVRAIRLAALRRLDAGGWFAPRFRGQRVPTLAETLALLRGRCGLHLELKPESRAAPSAADAALARAVAGVLARSRYREPVVISSFSRPALAAARAALPRADLGLLVSRSLRGVRAAHARLRLRSLHPHLRLASRRRIEAAHRLGLEVLVWPVNDLAEVRRLAGCGVEGIMTDEPRLVAAAIRPPGRPVPRPGDGRAPT